MAETFATLGEYIAAFRDEVQDVLEQVRAAMHAAAPESGETISYLVTAHLEARRAP